MNMLSIGGHLGIGTMVQRTRFKIFALRYYKEVGLIP